MNKEYVLSIGEKLSLGETTKAFQCPACGGKSGFSVTRIKTGILYHCFRATCTAAGYVPFISRESIIKPPAREKRRSGQHPIMQSRWLPLNNKEQAFMKDKFYMNSTTIEAEGIKWCPEYERMIFPMFDECGITWGVVARHYPDLARAACVGPKSLTLKDAGCEDALKIHFPYTYYEQNYVVLVEDPVSAIRMCGAGIACASILGTSVNNNILELFTGKTVLLALDKDACQAAIKIIQKYKTLYPTLEYWPLSGPDIKDMNPTDFKECTTRIWNYTSLGALSQAALPATPYVQ